MGSSSSSGNRMREKRESAVLFAWPSALDKLISRGSTFVLLVLLSFKTFSLFFSSFSLFSLLNQQQQHQQHREKRENNKASCKHWRPYSYRPAPTDQPTDRPTNTDTGAPVTHTHTHTHTDTTGVPTNGFWLFCVSFSVLFLLSVSVEWTNERASECQQTQRHCKKRKRQMHREKEKENNVSANRKVGFNH